jgi:hypothetical protein
VTTIEPGMLCLCTYGQKIFISIWEKGICCLSRRETFLLSNLDSHWINTFIHTWKIRHDGIRSSRLSIYWEELGSKGIHGWSATTVPNYLLRRSSTLLKCSRYHYKLLPSTLAILGKRSGSIALSSASPKSSFWATKSYKLG